MSTPLVARCSFNEEVHVFEFDSSYTISHLFAEVRDRWPQLNQEHTTLKYYTPDKDAKIVPLLKDRDVASMHRWHITANATHVSIAVDIQRPQGVSQPNIIAPPQQKQPAIGQLPHHGYVEDTNIKYISYSFTCSALLT
jgi:hypothetical protein